MSPRKIGYQGKPLVVHLSGVFRSVFKDLKAFRGTYTGWLERKECIGPVYRLPRESIIGLTRPPVGQRPILDETAAEVEMAFTDLCEVFKAIGYWNGRFIQAGYLVRPDPLPGRRELKELKWTRHQMW